MAGSGKKGGAEFHRPCREYPQCKHAKHGYTRKDHPKPGK